MTIRHVLEKHTIWCSVMTEGCMRLSSLKFMSKMLIQLEITSKNVCSKPISMV